MGDVMMEEGTSKAIPLRRSRNGARSAATRPPRPWSEALAGGARRVTEPPRQLWLASLGSAALALRGALATWERLVAEGAAAEGWLRHRLGRGSAS